jgi:hypothetical protein
MFRPILFQAIKSLQIFVAVKPVFSERPKTPKPAPRGVCFIMICFDAGTTSYRHDFVHVCRFEVLFDPVCIFGEIGVVRWFQRTNAVEVAIP